MCNSVCVSAYPACLSLLSEENEMKRQDNYEDESDKTGTGSGFIIVWLLLPHPTQTPMPYLIVDKPDQFLHYCQPAMVFIVIGSPTCSACPALLPPCLFPFPSQPRPSHTHAHAPPHRPTFTFPAPLLPVPRFPVYPPPPPSLTVAVGLTYRFGGCGPCTLFCQLLLLAAYARCVPTAHPHVSTLPSCGR